MTKQYVIEPLKYSQVTLQGDLARQFRETADYYYGINGDDMLKPYRQRAGLPAPGRDMGGVYVGHSPFGQFLAGYAKFYAVTGDEKYRAKAVYLMDEWAGTIEPDGFFFDKREPQLCAYIYEKLMGGLLDIYYYCGVPRALDYLRRITLWEMNNVPETRVYCDVIGQGTGEWYTQSENLYRAYRYTGDELYLRYAEKWEYTEYWNEILAGDYKAMYEHNPWHHAYSHVNTFCGLAAAYLTKGGERYLDTLKAAYDFMQSEQCYATGGYGSMENLQDRAATADKLRNRYDSFETQCGSWAGFKMSKYLTCLTGEAKYGDWIEKLIINGIGASIPMSGTGKAFYYSEYKTTGAHKRYNHNVAWPCCSGTRPQAVSEYYNLIYFADGDSIYAAQFFEASADIELMGSRITVSQRNQYPETEALHYDFSVSAPAEFAFKFRLPGWLAAPCSVRVNGKPFDIREEKGWGVIRRSWNDGDTVDIVLPMAFEARFLFDDKSNPWAICRGPVVMAVRAIEDMDNPALLIDPEKVSVELEQDPNEYLTWKLKADPDITLKPFYLFREGEQYFIYLDRQARMTFRSYRKASFEGDWKDFGGWKTAFSQGLMCEFSYTGKGIILHGVGYPDCGIGDVYLDGEKAGEADFYSPDPGAPVSCRIDAGEGTHTVRLVCSGRKNPASANIFVNVAKFELTE